ncbi:MAG TPA: cyclic nucleotide-binding domain-containing protein [Aggregatilineales bacterium]|nr:cyclic nucleotide-binding domain-containing protein [Anaerolineae bacterium]HUN07295.1 cyclic nucleotide-binding domain-containing protein [Aggregatilineales bacterium]
MADRFVLSQLRRQPLFTRLTPEQLELVASVVQVLRVNPGEMIFAQGQAAYGLAMFVSGEGQLTQFNPQTGGEVVIGHVRSGEYVNQDALFANIISPATLRITDEAVILSLSRAHMANLLSYYPDLQAAFQPAIPQANALSNDPPRAFKAQRANEDALLETHLHWWSFVTRAWLALLGAALALAGLFVAPIFAPTVPWPFLAFPLLALTGVGMIYFYLEWRNDKLTITGQRVMFEHRNLLTFRTIRNEIPIDGIHVINVDVPMTDFMARILNYGTLIIKTTGDTDNLVLKHTPNPKQVQGFIFDARKTAQEHKNSAERDARLQAIRGDIDRALGVDPQMAESKPLASKPGQSDEGWLSTRFTNAQGDTVYRKHRVVWFSHLMFPFGLFIGAGLLFAAATFGIMGQPAIGLAGEALAVVLAVISVIWMYWSDWDWRNDMYIVGDEKITIIHKRPLWLQDRTEQVLLAQVDNVVSETAGVINTLIQMGDVKILLSGTDEKSAKHFRNVYRPDDIQEEISRRQARTGEAAREADAARQRQAIVDYLAVYHQASGIQSGGSVAYSQGFAEPAQAPETPIIPHSRDRVRPPGIPLVRRDPPGG